MDINLPMSPPVNNNIQSTLCDRLDAVVFEKIRVVNTQLDARLSIQEKIINKYRHDVEKIHARQTRKIKREVKQLRQKKPDYVFDDSDISTSKSQNTVGTGRQRCMSEPSNLSYCRRYYSHHYNLKEAKKDDKKDKDTKKHKNNDFFNMKMRLYFVNMMNNVRQKTHLQHDVPDEHLPSINDHLGNHDQNPQSNFLTRFRDENTHADVVQEEELYISRNDEQNEPNSIHNVTEEDDDKVFQEVDHTAEIRISGTTNVVNENPRDINANMSWDVNRGRRRNRDSRTRRKSVLGSGSEEEMVYNETERRKAKHAFEKIFAGLL